MWAAAPTEQRIYKFAPNGDLLGRFGAGNLGQPMDVAFRGGLVYVADQNRNRIAVFNTSGVFQGAFGSKGSGNLQFNKPTGLAIDAAGRLYVADSLNERIQVFPAELNAELRRAESVWERRRTAARRRSSGGAGDRIRTDDLPITSQLRYRTAPRRPRASGPPAKVRSSDAERVQDEPGHADRRDTVEPGRRQLREPDEEGERPNRQSSGLPAGTRSRTSTPATA